MPTVSGGAPARGEGGDGGRGGSGPMDDSRTFTPGHPHDILILTINIADAKNERLFGAVRRQWTTRPILKRATCKPQLSADRQMRIHEIVFRRKAIRHRPRAHDRGRSCLRANTGKARRRSSRRAHPSVLRECGRGFAGCARHRYAVRRCCR